VQLVEKYGKNADFILRMWKSWPFSRVSGGVSDSDEPRVILFD
jgi:hypothetical protein